jgi:deazaflavin-dependent oxidoreductase (nitroreductase family)
MPLIDFSRKPSGWLKWALRAPTYLYRVRLGFVFGDRFVMVEHRGRVSGSRYFTVIEVAGHLPNEWISTSGTGPGADWYRNLRAGRFEALWVRSKRHRAVVRFLTDAEAADVMAPYERAHPRTAARLFKMMDVSYDGTDAGRVEMMKRIPMVGFAPKRP